MPAYEIYLDRLRAGFFDGAPEPAKTQLHVLLDRSRNVVELEIL